MKTVNIVALHYVLILLVPGVPVGLFLFPVVSAGPCSSCPSPCRPIFEYVLDLACVKYFYKKFKA